MSVDSKRVLAVIGLVALGVMAWFSLTDTWRRSQKLSENRSQLTEFRRMLDDIKTLENRPSVAALQVQAADEILNRIYTAVGEAGLPERMLSTQTPSAPQRLERSDYMSQAVTIKLNRATVKQVVALCDALKDDATGCLVRDLRFSNPMKQGARETWDCQLTLTQVTFSPKSDS
ncbi:hypothetical protein [Roseiconus lacunae]|uniref:hypothetical protein n=1 Tax=Roseiconus lacunae TaxID=2605694 RepID=UPI001E59DDC2|nr:hypothetical protein [Roseiconus lacunae]MCD0458793.1 hypothetical protein [Roseiconus lacunae]